MGQTQTKSQLNGPASKLPPNDRPKLSIFQQIKYSFLKAWDFAQSVEGGRKIRSIIIPIIMSGAFIMLIIGAIWVRLLDPECGETLESARFSVQTESIGGPSTGGATSAIISNNGNFRLLSGNSCPGYAWKTQTSRLTAGEYPFSYKLPLNPRIAAKPVYVGTSNPITGPIGIAVNGVMIYSPATVKKQDAVTAESKFFDSCGGHNAPPRAFAFSAPITGYYHYISMPGAITKPSTSTSTSTSTSSNSNSQSSTSSFKYCAAASNWYNETKGVAKHSPLVGFMVDGIPIYGPNGLGGRPPTDLDKCGGHSSDQLRFYHYHMQTKYPYSVNCLVGCMDGSINPHLDNGGDKCAVNRTSTYDYTSIKTLKIEYGGDGVNKTNWTGPALLLSFGFLIFIPSALCCACISCARRPSHTHDAVDAGGYAPQLADVDEFSDDQMGDNVL